MQHQQIVYKWSLNQLLFIKMKRKHPTDGFEDVDCTKEFVHVFFFELTLRIFFNYVGIKR